MLCDVRLPISASTSFKLDKFEMDATQTAEICSKVVPTLASENAELSVVVSGMVVENIGTAR